MTVLDENIDAVQRHQLRQWKVHFRRIGGDVGRYGMKDRNEIIPLLHSLRHITFFTRDHDFYHPWLRHPNYCLVYLEVTPGETALFVRGKKPTTTISPLYTSLSFRLWHQISVDARTKLDTRDFLHAAVKASCKDCATGAR